MADYAPALPHSEISEPFANVFFVTGTATPTFMGQQWQYSRNMCVLRHDGELTIINSVRLDDAGLSSLEALGNVKRVMKLGAFHGMDDAFYVDRYSASLCTPPMMSHDSGKTTDVELHPGPLPFLPHASLFCFETTKVPEGVIHLAQDDGILISCDSLQNWARPDRFFDEVSATKMAEFGFIRPANIGPGWRRAAEPRLEDFTRLMTLDFRHLVPAHGEILRDSAHEAFRKTISEAFSD